MSTESARPSAADLPEGAAFIRSPHVAAPPKCRPDQAIAVISPSMAAPAIGPEVHEQAMARLRKLTGREVVEYPTTRQFGASAVDRARDVTAAFADPSIGAIMSTVGGMDQITVLPHLDRDTIAANPKPFLGYSDNTHLHSFLWRAGIESFYGGSTQVQLGQGSGIDDEQASSLVAATLTGGVLRLDTPALSEDFGKDWQDPAALTEDGDRRAAEPYEWFGPARTVSGPTWGGCIQVLSETLMAAQFKEDDRLDGAILAIENSNDLIDPELYSEFLRALGERGILRRLVGVAFGRTATSKIGFDVPDDEFRAAYRQSLTDMTHYALERYNPEAVVCVGIPFGHTRPQWIIPYGGSMILDGAGQAVYADYR